MVGSAVVTLVRLSDVSDSKLSRRLNRCAHPRCVWGAYTRNALIRSRCTPSGELVKTWLGKFSW